MTTKLLLETTGRTSPAGRDSPGGARAGGARGRDPDDPARAPPRSRGGAHRCGQVYAWGQVVLLRGRGARPRRRTVSCHPTSRCWSSSTTPSGFDAHDARSRTYCFRILNRRSRACGLRGTAGGRAPVAAPALDACARRWSGTHDFTAFTPTQTGHVRFERRRRLPRNGASQSRDCSNSGSPRTRSCAT